MRLIWGFFIIFLLAPEVVLAKNLHSIGKLTFLINYWQPDNPYYHNLEEGFKELKKNKILDNFRIVSYNNNSTELVKKFNDVLSSSNALVMAFVVDKKDIHLAEYFAQKTEEKKIPLIFITRRPSLRILDKYPHVYYVGQDNISAGLQQGLLISHYLEKHPEVDKNHDGQINILNVVGDLSKHGSGHQRVQWQLNTVSNYPGSNFRVKEIGEWSADYNYQKTKDIIEKALTDGSINNIEVIATQSDVMAKAVADTITNKVNIPIFGRDGDKEIVPYLKDQRIKGTISSPLSKITYYSGLIAYNEINKLDSNMGIPYLLYNRQLELPYIPLDASNVEGN